MNKGFEFVPLERRFWSKVNKLGEDDCWEWTAGKFNSGCSIRK
jgi:hypothetical protein